MATQQHYYPCNQTAGSLCIKCNNGLNSPRGTNGTNCSRRNSGSPGTDNSIGCSSYCNSSCNSKCESS
jgi:hypothetical protein